MSIQAVNSAQFVETYNKQPAFKSKTHHSEFLKDNTKLETCLTALGVFGLAAVCFTVGRKGVEPLKNFKHNVVELVKKPKDPMVKALRGRRDAKAVKKYNLLVAQKKLDSLTVKVQSHQFDTKPARALHKILDNMAELQDFVQPPL